MPGNYVHNAATDGIILTAAIYNGDHQNHVDNFTPAGVGDYSDNLTQLQQNTDPGTVGAEALPTDFSGELARIRYAINRLIGKTKWYETPTNTATIGGNQTLTAEDFGYMGFLRKITASADLTLPAASSVSASKRLLIKNTGNFVVNLLRAGTDTVDALTQIIIPPYCVAEIMSNGTNAYYIAENPYRITGHLTLTDAATIAWDHHTQPNGQVTLGGNRTLDNPSSTQDGTSHTLLVIQDATGSRTLAYGSNYRWPLNTAPVLSTAKSITGTVTVTIATPAVFALVSHGLTAGRFVYFTTTGALPTGIVAGQRYFVIAAGLTADAFEVSDTPSGTAINTSGTQSGVHTVTSQIMDKLSFITIGGLHYGVAEFNAG